MSPAERARERALFVREAPRRSGYFLRSEGPRLIIFWLLALSCATLLSSVSELHIKVPDELCGARRIEALLAASCGLLASIAIALWRQPGPSKQRSLAVAYEHKLAARLCLLTDVLWVGLLLWAAPALITRAPTPQGVLGALIATVLLASLHRSAFAFAHIAARRRQDRER